MSDEWVHSLRRGGETLHAAKLRLEASGARPPPSRRITPRRTTEVVRAQVVRLFNSGRSADAAARIAGADPAEAEAWIAGLREGRR